jgi:transmembrane 9 superfamily member 2/4
MLADNTTCQTLCTTQVSAEDAKFINDRIREDYALNWLIDGLPAAEMKMDLRTGDLFFDMGFSLGDSYGPEKEPVLNNHYEIVLRFVHQSSVFSAFESINSCFRYHTPSPGKIRIVGVLVWPLRFVHLFSLT